MRQEPVYTIIGHGKLALHMAWYLHLCKSKVYQWSRSTQLSPLFEKITTRLHSLSDIPDKSHCLIAISDDSLQSFIKKNKDILKKHQIILFCGGIQRSCFCLDVNIYHPLNTFTNELYQEEIYRKTYFVEEAGSRPFKEIFPKLKNKTYSIKSDKKHIYHALLAALCNFNSAIMQIVFSELDKNQLNLPMDALYPLCIQTLDNAFHNPEHCLTGAIARKDKQLIHNHIKSLDGTKLEQIYKTLLKHFEINLQG